MRNITEQTITQAVLAAMTGCTNQRLVAEWVRHAAAPDSMARDTEHYTLDHDFVLNREGLSPHEPASRRRLT